MKEFIISLLNTFGLGINAYLVSTSQYVKRLQNFTSVPVELRDVDFENDQFSITVQAKEPFIIKCYVCKYVIYKIEII